MAKPTEGQIRALEKALGEQFFNLVQGARFRINLARLGDPKKPLTENAAFMSYNRMYVPLVKKWLAKEIKYEKAMLQQGVKGLIASGDLKADDFFHSEALPKLDALVKKWDTTAVNGIGFIPLIIWAVIAIAGLFTAETIVDDLTTTTQEKEQLMVATKQTGADLKLSPAQCQAMISQTQAEASKGSGLGDTVTNLAMIGIGGFVLFNILKPKSA